MSLVLLILPLIISWVCLIKTINKLPSEELVSIKFIDGEGREEEIAHVYTLYCLHCVKPSKVGAAMVLCFLKASTVLFDIIICIKLSTL